MDDDSTIESLAMAMYECIQEGCIEITGICGRIKAADGTWRVVHSAPWDEIAEVNRSVMLAAARRLQQRMMR